MADVDVAEFGEFVDESLVGFVLDVVEESEGLRLKARFGGIGVGNDGVDLHPYDTGFRVNPSLYFRASSLQGHSSPVEKFMFQAACCGW